MPNSTPRLRISQNRSAVGEVRATIYTSTNNGVSWEARATNTLAAAGTNVLKTNLTVSLYFPMPAAVRIAASGSPSSLVVDNISIGILTIDDAVRILDSALHPDAWPDLPGLPPLGRGRKRDKTDVEQHKRRRLLEGTDPSRWTAALLQGMRQGECLGLTWSSVDLKIGTMDISWQLKRYAVDAAVPPGLATRRLDGQYILTAPKTKAGKRIIPLVPWMVTALERWRDLCPESEHDLVWPRPSGGPISKGDDLAAWYGLLDVAGVHKPGPKQWVLHEARHTTVSLLEAAGVPPAVIIAIVGHATYASTRRYSHTELARARAALATVADDLGLPSVKGGKKGKRKAPKPQALTAG